MEQKDKISIFELSLLCGYVAQKSDSTKTYFEQLLECGGFQKDIDAGITTSCCEKFGANGWVICPFWCPDTEKGETILGTWEEKINNGKADDIAQYFTNNNFEFLNEVIGRMRFEFPRDARNWFNEAVDNFFSQKYLSCAFILTALLERTVRDMPNYSKWKWKVIKFFENSAIKNIERIETGERPDTLNILYEQYFYLPSLEKFIEVYYDLKGYPFENQIEPDMLIRDWLMHGMTRKQIRDIECIKLFNALSTFMFLRNNLSRE